jgi:magnesium and cobalt transporter
VQAFCYLPKRGETIELQGFTFKVTSADSRRLIQLRVTVSDEQLALMEQAHASDAQQESYEERCW